MRGTKFVVIALVMNIGFTLSCCVNPRRYACSAGEECASNPRHCSTCHKTPVNVRVKRAAYNQTEKETKRNLRGADYYIKTNTALNSDDFAKGDKEIIYNEIANNIATAIDSQTTSVTLIFLNASYDTHTNTKESWSIENSTVHETMSQAQTTLSEQLVSALPDLKKRVPKLRKTYQRGILDLLFPAARLITFKAYLEALKRFLSATF